MHQQVRVGTRVDKEDVTWTFIDKLAPEHPDAGTAKRHLTTRAMVAFILLVPNRDLPICQRHLLPLPLAVCAYAMKP